MSHHTNACLPHGEKLIQILKCKNISEIKTEPQSQYRLELEQEMKCVNILYNFEIGIKRMDSDSQYKNRPHLALQSICADICFKSISNFVHITLFNHVSSERASTITLWLLPCYGYVIFPNVSHSQVQGLRWFIYKMKQDGIMRETPHMQLTDQNL